MIKKDYVIVLIFVLIGVATRTVFHFGHNIEFVTALSISSGYFIKNKKLVFFVPFGIMLVSDVLIGNSIIFLFTWSAFLLAPLFGIVMSWVSKRVPSSRKYLSLLISSEISGIVFTIIFFLWTNLGVVLASEMYPKSLYGVMQSYIAGIPFMNNQFFSNIIIVPFVFTIIYFLNEKWSLKYSKKYNKKGI